MSAVSGPVLSANLNIAEQNVLKGVLPESPCLYAAALRVLPGLEAVGPLVGSPPGAAPPALRAHALQPHVLALHSHQLPPPAAVAAAA